MVLQSIRERLTGIIAIFIFAILIIPFAFVGVNSYFTSDAVNSVARVNDVDITVNEFQQGFQNYRRRMQSVMGANFDPIQFDQPIIRRQYLDTLIDRVLLTQVAAESGLTVDDDRLAQAIRELPGFQVDGVFNPDVYQSRLLSQGTTPQGFENDLREQMILEQYPEAVSSSAIATQWELRELVRLQDQQRSFKAIVLKAESATGGEDSGGESAVEAGDAAPIAADTQPEETEPSASVEAAGDSGIEEEAITAWYESHPELYRSQEEVTIEYVELDAEAMVDDVEPDEDQLRARFEEQKARFVTPEARLASHILIEVAPDADAVAIETARQQAETLSERAREGEDFADLASEYSQDAGSASLGGDLGWVEPGFMVQAFEDGLYALTLNSPISDPVQTGFGWHVIELREIRPAEGMSFEEARDTIASEYAAESRERKFLEQADRLVDIIYEDPTTLAAAAEELGLEVMRIGPFTRAGGEGLAANPDVVAAAFSDLVLQQGAVSDPVDLGENHIVMIRLAEYFPESVLPLSDVRDQVVASVRRERAMQSASQQAEELLAALNDGADIAELAAGQSLELLDAVDVRRDSSEFPRDLLSEVFMLQRPDGEASNQAIVSLGDGFAVVQLESVSDGEISTEDLLRMKNYRQRIETASANAEMIGFLRMLRKQSEIEVFEDRL